MVTLLRPHRHAHGPAAVDVRRLQLTVFDTTRGRRRSDSSQHPPPPPSSWCFLRSMAQDPSHPHRQSKDTAAAPPPPPPQEQPQQQQPELITAPPPRDDVAHQEPSTSSSSGGGGTDAAGLSLQLGLGPSAPGSPSSSRRKRPRTDAHHEAAAGPSTSAADPQLPELRLSVLHPGPGPSSSASAVGAVVAAAPPPPAHEAGTWFVLRAAQNQRREPPLPQIPRSFLRVRDGRMTVRVVMRYLVNKLSLEDDSQLEITCRGQRLPPEMTLQHVRDTIWRTPPAEAAAVLPAPGSLSTNQVMTLNYGRS